MKPMEIRIYFECLEQAYHYVLPIVKSALNNSGHKNLSVRLVRTPSNSSLLRKGALSTIYSLTTPDFLISLCNKDAEIPVIVGEFTESVLTEDHELQRAIGAVASCLTKVVFLKISGRKPSEREHGGKKDFNPFTPVKILSQLYGYSGYIIGKWPLQQDNEYVLRRDQIYRSCPEKDLIPLAEQTITCAVLQTIENYDKILKGQNDVASLTIGSLSQTKEFKEFLSGVNDSEASPPILDLTQFIEDWKSRKGKSNRPRIVLDDKKLELKINRFSHAADPDRGMLIFSSFVLPMEEIAARYIVKADITNANSLVKNFVAQAIKEKMPSSLVKELEKEFVKRSHAEDQLDITAFLKKTYKEWFENNVLFSIFLFSNSLLVQNKNRNVSFRFKWNTKEIFGVERQNFKSSLSRFFESEKYLAPLPVYEVKKDLTEDEATYIVVHQILRPNNYEVLSISYPGAQGDLAILPERTQKKGRMQRRLYIDVVAWLPPLKELEGKNDLVLEESKASFSKTSVENTILKLDDIRRNTNKKRALKEALSKIGEQREIAHIWIGIAFGLDRLARTTWEPSKVDFIVRILKRKSWQVAPFGSRLKLAFKDVEGDIKLPQVYKIIAKENDKTTPLEHYMTP